MNAVYVLMALAPPALLLMAYAEDRCTRLDVATGRREAMALVDDYGSNRGWYWPWSPLIVLCFLIAAPGSLMWGALVLVVIGSN